MYDSDHTFSLLERLGATKSKIEKLSILKEADETTREFMHRAMNPFITYGVKPKPPTKTGVNAIALGHMAMLDDLPRAS